MTEPQPTSRAGRPALVTASGRRWGALAALGLALVVTALLLQGPAPARGADDPALRERLALALAAADAPDAALAAVKPKRDPGLAQLRRVATRLRARHRRDAAALVAALGQPGAAGSRALIQAASRLRADALDLAALARRVKPRSRAARRARAGVLETQAAAVEALDAIRGFGRSTDTATAVAQLSAAERALGQAQARARAASRRMGCRKPCGSGF
jgi:hypothetical protein